MINKPVMSRCSRGASVRRSAADGGDDWWLEQAEGVVERGDEVDYIVSQTPAWNLAEPPHYSRNSCWVIDVGQSMIGCHHSLEGHYPMRSWYSWLKSTGKRWRLVKHCTTAADGYS